MSAIIIVCIVSSFAISILTITKTSFFEQNPIDLLSWLGMLFLFQLLVIISDSAKSRFAKFWKAGLRKMSYEDIIYVLSFPVLVFLLLDLVIPKEVAKFYVAWVCLHAFLVWLTPSSAVESDK